ncbi:DUF2306 domain-containing protein [Oceanobacillus sp. Castelsardo]|uniref:DUF2306 domain-containing protein n=1 Tax=Oceanobacillus sp. Castelsardo TaxID=1851204 RepID=UPI000838319C|nr:DUF2306 domain-containing protein [Oceanobacillus sp. Castelsardo]
MMSTFLVIHILTGILCLITGIFAMLAKKGRGKHTRFGKVYHLSYLGVFVTAILMSIINWEESQYLFYIALFSYSLALLGFLSVKKKNSKKWLSLHLSGMLGSYIGIVTATLVVNIHKVPYLNQFPVLLFWFLPTIIGTPFIFMIGKKYRSKFSKISN